MVLYHVLADLVVVFHAAYVAFVVFGFGAILIGVAMGWEWVRDLRFRIAHLAAIGFVALEAIAGWMCPLTSLEDRLRFKAGQAPYPGDFIGYGLHALIYYDFPAWVFTTVYLAFGVLVAAVFIVAPPRVARRGRGA